MICSMLVDQERVESMCTPSNLYVVTLSTVCDAVSADDQEPFVWFCKYLFPSHCEHVAVHSVHAHENS